MAAPVNVTAKGALKLQNIPDNACFSNFKEFVESLPEYLTVEVPASISNVVISQAPPGEDDKNKLWFRRDASGNFIGIYVFQSGAWRPFYNLVIGAAVSQITWAHGSSSNVPDGFRLILANDPTSNIPQAVRQAIQSQYVPDGSGGFLYFALEYIGV